MWRDSVQMCLPSLPLALLLPLPANALNDADSLRREMYEWETRWNRHFRPCHLPNTRFQGYTLGIFRFSSLLLLFFFHFTLLLLFFHFWSVLYYYFFFYVTFSVKLELFRAKCETGRVPVRKRLRIIAKRERWETFRIRDKSRMRVSEGSAKRRK